VAASIVKRPRTATDNPAMDYQTADSDLVLKRSRPFGIIDEVLYIHLQAILTPIVLSL